MDLNPATTTSAASAASQEDWFHLVISTKRNVAFPGCPSRFGFSSINPANPDKGTRLGPSSGLSPQQLNAIKKLTDYLMVLEATGLTIGCCCQINRAQKAEMTAAPTDVVEEPVTSAESNVPVPSDVESESSVQSGSLAQPEALIKGETPNAAGSSVAIASQNDPVKDQINSDYVFACKLHEGEVAAQILSGRPAGKNERTGELATIQTYGGDRPAAGVDRPANKPISPKWTTERYYY